MDARQVIIAVMQDVQGVAKRDRNQAQGFNFRGIDAVLNAVGPSIRKHGGFIVPEVISSEATVGQTAKGSPINIVRLQVAFGIYGSEGEPVVGTVASEAFDSGDKATAKAMSVALRTFLLQLLALPTDEPDPDSFSYEATQRDFLKEADEAALKYDLDGLRLIYADARAAKVDSVTLEKIEAYAKELKQG